MCRAWSRWSPIVGACSIKAPFPSRGIAGVILMQYLPFADAKALVVYDAFERGAYQLASADR